MPPHRTWVSWSCIPRIWSDRHGLRSTKTDLALIAGVEFGHGLLSMCSKCFQKRTSSKMETPSVNKNGIFQEQELSLFALRFSMRISARRHWASLSCPAPRCKLLCLSWRCNWTNLTMFKVKHRTLFSRGMIKNERKNRHEIWNLWFYDDFMMILWLCLSSNFGQRFLIHFPVGTRNGWYTTPLRASGPERTRGHPAMERQPAGTQASWTNDMTEYVQTGICITSTFMNTCCISIWQHTSVLQPTRNNLQYFIFLKMSL